MPRNIERDAREAERRKKQLIEEGFRLFSEHGIEGVSLQTVAVAADVGVATMYKYFLTKINLLVAISASIWQTVWQKSLAIISQEQLQTMNAYELLEFYADRIIDLYMNNPEILRFSSEYKTFVCRAGFSKDQVSEQMDVLSPISELFHMKYEQAKTDGCIRMDISEKELYTTVSLTMLGMAERYAQGLVWAMQDDRDYTNELLHLKDMMLSWVKG